MSGGDSIVDVRFAQGLCAFNDFRSPQGSDRIEQLPTGVKGNIIAAGLARLVEELREPGGDIEFQIKPVAREDAHAAIEVSVVAELKLTCQRCLGALDYSVRSKRQIVFVTPALLPEIDDEDEFADFVPIDSKFELRELIEEEVLLSLPMVPVHDDGKCHAVTADLKDANVKVSPFAVLGKPSKQ